MILRNSGITETDGVRYRALLLFLFDPFLYRKGSLLCVMRHRCRYAHDKFTSDWLTNQGVFLLGARPFELGGSASGVSWYDSDWWWQQPKPLMMNTPRLCDKQGFFLRFFFW